MLDNVFLGNGLTIYTPAIEMKGSNALSIAITQLVGTVAAAVVATEGSYDLQTWSPVGITDGVTTTTAAPSLTKGISTGVYYRYGRVKITGGAGNTIINVDVGLLALG